MDQEVKVRTTRKKKISNSGASRSECESPCRGGHTFNGCMRGVLLVITFVKKKKTAPREGGFWF